MRVNNSNNYLLVIHVSYQAMLHNMLLVSSCGILLLVLGNTDDLGHCDRVEVTESL
jgi:hypothetical protein